MFSFHIRYIFVKFTYSVLWGFNLFDEQTKLFIFECAQFSQDCDDDNDMDGIGPTDNTLMDEENEKTMLLGRGSQQPKGNKHQTDDKFFTIFVLFFSPL